VNRVVKPFVKNSMSTSSLSSLTSRLTVCTFVFVAVAVFLAVVSGAWAEPEANPARQTDAAQPSKVFEEQVQPFFQLHCIKCHGPEKAEAKLRLDTLGVEFINRPAADHWVEILDRMNLGEMPPEGEPRPAAAQLTAVTDWITSELQQARKQAQSTGGRVLLRRLSRTEYANTIRDLLQVEFAEGNGLREMLPPDGSIGGFDKVSKALLLDPSLMEAYLTAAKQIAEKAIITRPPLIPQRTMRFEFKETANSAMSYLLTNREAELQGSLMVLREGGARTYGKLRHPSDNKEIPITGRYRVRVQAAADIGKRGDPLYMDIVYGAEGRQARFRVDAPREAPKVYEFEKTFDATLPGEFQVNLVNGTRFREGNAEWYELSGKLTKLAEEGQSVVATRMKARMRAEGAYDSSVRGSYVPQALHLDILPALFVGWIEVIGPLQEEFPPKSLEQIFGRRDVSIPPAESDTSDPAVVSQTIALARDAFSRLLPRAFRRPVVLREIDALVSVVREELQNRVSPEEALRTGLVAMLCTPDFLLLFEGTEPAGAIANKQPATTTASQTERKLTDYELAVRLSYFLWSSLPDDELLLLAKSGTLQQPTVLSAQVQRMLADPKSEGLVQGFARQWLKVAEMTRFKPDEQIYPRFYATEMVGIDKDVETEPLAFFREILNRREPVNQFLNSDWLMLNERLAKLYGIEGVTGLELRRVALDRKSGTPEQEVRGGLLGMAGVHLWGADGNRTKPVERGKYILDVLFNDPPSPPPPNAGEVEPNLRGAVLTVRERLQKHREQATCNSCHRRIDPFGLAMENFNAIGQWREKLDGERPLAQLGENRPVIDPSGTLPNGRAFKTFGEFRTAVTEQRERFIRSLAEKLFVYALGRTIEPPDRTAIDAIVAEAKGDEATLPALISGVVRTRQFLSK